MSPPTAYLTKSGLAHQQIKQMILSGEMRPGSRVKLGEVSRRLGISETPIREAMTALHAEGWLDMTSHVGAVVRDITVEQVLEIASIRGRISGLAIELNGPHFDEAMLQELKDNVQAMSEAVRRGDLQKMSAINDEFHRLLSNGPFSPWCARIMESVLGLTSYLRHGIVPKAERLREQVREHRKLVKHLCDGDFRAAAATAELHERNGGLFLIGELNRAKASEEQHPPVKTAPRKTRHRSPA
ncbi:MAG: GntR family transcriptional regulator [Proteobacteria bacterium]|nr:GntR family transcriptional regulator [Pseudomonadota bacterium]